MKIKLAVMSDLHCHLSEESDPVTQRIVRPESSFLTVGALRRPSTHHPIQALVDLIHDQTMATEALLVPGDLANQASQEGLAHAWDSVLEIGRELRAQYVIPVLGNHDLDTHKVRGTRTPTHAAEFLRPGFPFASPLSCQQFLSEGYCVLPLTPEVEIILVNTVIDYSDRSVAKRGSFPIERVENLRQTVGLLPRPKIRIAMMHHHPILHSTKFMNVNDVIETGDQLLSALREVGCGLVIHGHKHEPRLTQVNIPTGSIAVFAAGSFSAMLGQISSVARNLFHLVQVESLDSPDVILRGSITSWEWAKGSGWVKALLFPHHIGFGRRVTLETMLGQLRKLAASKRLRQSFNHDEILVAAPELQYSSDDDVSQMSGELRKDRLKFAKPGGVFELGKLNQVKGFTKR
ncbi:MAG TPA: metallophosphoesterase [Candidatus Angelobacter sp.]|nr:metallophosphoesterase [Candidatus Angelobacter sp.]